MSDEAVIEDVLAMEEAKAISGVAKALAPLPAAARLRVLKWALDFNHEEAKKQAIESKKQLDELRKDMEQMEKGPA